MREEPVLAEASPMTNRRHSPLGILKGLVAVSFLEYYHRHTCLYSDVKCSQSGPAGGGASGLKPESRKQLTISNIISY